MHGSDDDLAAWQDDPIVQALTAPPTSDELAGEQHMLAAYRAHRPAVSRRRFVGRIGLGATTLVVAVGLSGGVAAAYTSSLPDSVQRVVHGLLGPVGVPAAPESDAAQHHRAHGSVTAGGAGSSGTHPTVVVGGSASPAPGVTPGTGIGRAPVVRRHPSAAPSPAVSASPNAGSPAPAPPSSSPTPTASPSAAPDPYGDPATWTLAASAARPQVRVHHGTVLHGQLLAADGTPVAGHRVVALVHEAGTPGWQRLGARRTGDDGTMSIWTRRLVRNVRLVLRAGHGVRTEPVSVLVRPTLSTALTTTSDGRRYVVDVTADGGDAGDTVVLLRRRQGQWARVRAAQLNDAAHAGFAVRVPAGHQVRYAVRLQPTRWHAASWSRFVAQPA